MINTIRISTMQELVTALNDLPNHYIYRGHADADWKLISTLERIGGSEYDEDFVENCEKLSLSTFKAKFHIYDTQNDPPSSKLEWLAIMQHYGVPTRLLDFTTSPYIALYFAIENYSPGSAKDFAIYAINYKEAMRASINLMSTSDKNFKEDEQSISLEGRQDRVYEEHIDRFSYPILWATEPAKLNVRVDRQCGCFLLTGKRTLTVEDALQLNTYERVDARKYIIPGAMFQHVFALLRKVNISATTIYGDLQGLAGSLRTYIAVASAARKLAKTTL